MEAALVPEKLDIFAQHADCQYTRTLLFSSMVELLVAIDEQCDDELA